MGKPKVQIKWAVGVTTCPVRFDTLLPPTLASIKSAGFPPPRLFVDGCKNEDAHKWEDKFGLEVTCRFPPLMVAMNWHGSLQELFFRNPAADRFAMFQDDLLCVANLREYLDRLPYPDGVYEAKGQPGYLNLYNAPSNQAIVPTDQTARREPIKGFYLSNQLGKGAVALVFSRQAVLTLLASDHLTGRPVSPDRGWRLIDGGIADSFKKAGWKEYVHHPSLVLHTGKERSFHSHNGSQAGTNGMRPQVWHDHYDATSFPGESFNALELLQDAVAK